MILKKNYQKMYFEQSDQENSSIVFGSATF